MTSMAWLKGIKAIGFDVDGTLYSYSSEASIEINREVARKGAELLNKDIDEFSAEYLNLKERYRGNTLTLNSMGLPGEKIYQEVFDKFPIEKYHQQDKELVAGMRKLGKKYRLFILSNGTQRQVVRKLKVLGLNPADFSPLIACYDHEWVKPAPAPFLYCLEKLELRPHEVLYVGDRTDVDIDASQAVGMRAALIGAEYAGADLSCETVYDLVSVLR